MATAARLTIAVFGLDQSQEHEGGTRSIIALPGVQEQLLEKLAVRDTGLSACLTENSSTD